MRLSKFSGVLMMAFGALPVACFDTDITCGDELTCSAGRGGTSGKGGSAGAGATAVAGASGQGNGDGGGASGTSGSGGAPGMGGDGGVADAGRGGASGGGANGGEGNRSGDAGEAGAGGVAPCDGACGGTLPVCYQATNTCVECLESAECEGETPACDTSTNECVECTEGESDACMGETPLCDADANLCVGCLAAADCPDAAESRCTDAKECAPCVDSGDCAHIAGKNVCDNGLCVQCTVSTEATACGLNACDPATKTCTETERGSVGICLPCAADSECAGGDLSDPEQRCVPMEFQAVPRPGGFCLRRASKTCSRPYQIPITAPSLSGADPETYCGIDTATTRCEAVLDLVNSRECMSGMDSSCGCLRDQDGNCTEVGQGGLCRTVGVNANQCTYPCGVINHCPTGTTCAGTGATFCQ